MTPYFHSNSFRILVLISCLSCLPNAFAAKNNDDTDVWLSNLRWAVDLSTRHVNSLRGENSSWQHVIGLDLHKVFQNEHGDIGTLLFQPYLVRLSNVKNPPFYFADGDDWELTWRMTNFNYTQLAQGKFNIRVGHFEVPFGLEQNIDTNGTLRQSTFSNRGLKADWGASINGALENSEYEIAITRGSGMEYSASHDPYLISSRLGSPSNKNFVAGLSGFYGEILNANGTTKQKLLGVDIAYYVYQWELLLETTGGETNDNAAMHFLTELSWRSPIENLHLYSQLRQNFNKPTNNWDDSTRITFGADYSVNNLINIGAELNHDINVMNNVSRQTNFLLQFRLRI